MGVRSEGRNSRLALSGPFRYGLKFSATRIIAVEAQDGGRELSGPAALRVPKLYVISNEERPLYVGVTRQTMRTRLRIGFDANGAHGYHGYAWRRSLEQVMLDVWIQSEGGGDTAGLETVEAEVVFLIRQEFGQWPDYQTEIHFHRSDVVHREIARRIIAHYQR